MKFRVDFGAKDEGRLSPFEDDKPKDAEITLLKASSDNYCHAILFCFLHKKCGWFYGTKA